MVYISLILSIGIFIFVTRMMLEQKRFDFLNGVIITGALIGVLLDISTVWTGQKYDAAPFIGFAVIILWFFNRRRKPLENE